jgi:hypothetical protein
MLIDRHYSSLLIITHHYSSFLISTHLYPGRAVYYLLLGLLVLSRGELLDLLVGGVALAHAVLLLVSAKRVSKVFNEFHSAKYTEGELRVSTYSM